ncbi:hypothetical protein FRC07_007479, partial [Ceratobasidium sp. 392]
MPGLPKRPSNDVINGLILGTLVHPLRIDFDDWNTPGWGSKDLIPLLQKLETYHPAPGRDTHGYDGPIHISYSDYYSTTAQ